MACAPRAKGTARVAVKSADGQTRLKDLYHSGSMKVLFPRTDPNAAANMQAVLINTAGGITGGDRFDVDVTATENTALSVTTQAAERAYRAQPGQIGQLHTKLHVAPGATLNWLPQETLIFQGSALKRSLDITLEDSAKASAQMTYVEPVLFGRDAMGETVSQASFDDCVRIRRAGKLMFQDATKMTGDIQAQLDRPAVANGARALATLVHISPRAESLLTPLRQLLPKTAGASLLAPDILVLRALAPDGFELRKFLMPVLRKITGDDLPRPWMI